jgi:hypothetical protein
MKQNKCIFFTVQFWLIKLFNLGLNFPENHQKTGELSFFRFY